MAIEDNPSNDLKLLLGEDEEKEVEVEKATEEDKDDDEDSSEDDKPKDSEEADKEDEEVEDDESDEDEDSEEDSDLDEKVGAAYPGRPTYRQLKEYDPKLLKKFPGLRDTFFREREFTKIYPTVEDAQEAYNDLNRLKVGEQRITKADAGDFLEILNDYDPEKEKKFIREFLPSLHKRNKTAFQAVVEPVVKNALRAMFTDAKRNGNANLEASALNAHEWLFGDDKIETPAKIETTQNTPDPEKEELRRQNQRILQERHQEFITTILDTASPRLKKKILNEVPEDTSEFLRNSITKEVMSGLAKVLRDDPSHRSNMDRMLRQASKDNYSVTSKDRILTAYLSRAMLGIPGILKKVKAEALKGAKPRVETPKRPNGASGSAPRKDVTKVDADKAKLVKSGKISALDFLNS